MVEPLTTEYHPRTDADRLNARTHISIGKPKMESVLKKPIIPTKISGGLRNRTRNDLKSVE